MPVAFSASNVMWGVLFVYVARKVISMSEGAKVKQQALKDFPPEMRDAAIDTKGPAVLPRGPFAERQ